MKSKKSIVLTNSQYLASRAQHHPNIRRTHMHNARTMATVGMHVPVSRYRPSWTRWPSAPRCTERRGRGEDARSEVMARWVRVSRVLWPRVRQVRKGSGVFYIPRTLPINKLAHRDCGRSPLYIANSYCVRVTDRTTHDGRLDACINTKVQA